MNSEEQEHIHSVLMLIRDELDYFQDDSGERQAGSQSQGNYGETSISDDFTLACETFSAPDYLGKSQNENIPIPLRSIKTRGEQYNWKQVQFHRY